jgi:ADP-dependent phosphofructokinase/glucokinase
LVDDLSGPALGTTASIIDISVQNFAFYPNPATSQLTFIGNLDGELAQVFDVLGRKQLSKAIVNNKLNVDKLDNGVYFLKVQGQVKKLIIK